MTFTNVSHWVGGFTNVIGGSTQGRVFLRRNSSGTINALFKDGDLIGSEAIRTNGISFEYDVSPTGNNILQQLQIGASTAIDEVLVLNGSPIAREGGPAPGGTWTGTFYSPQINSAGQYVFLNEVNTGAGNAEALHTPVQSIFDGAIMDGRVASGDARLASINSQGRVAFLWGSTTDSGIWIGVPGLFPASRLIIQTGSQIDTDGDWVADSVVNSLIGSSTIGPGFHLTDNGTVVTKITYTSLNGGPTNEAVVAIPLPKPGDINRDDEVGPSDFALLAFLFGTDPSSANWDADADLDWDGEVGPGDFAILAANFGS